MITPILIMSMPELESFSSIAADAAVIRKIFRLF